MDRSVMRCLVASVVLFGLVAGAPGAEATEEPAGLYRGLVPVARFDVSPPLRDIAPLPPPSGPVRDRREGLKDEDLDKPLGPQSADGALQTEYGPSTIPTPLVSFNGPPNISSVSPPDPVGDVGPNHYVAMSNLSFQVFDKLGNSLYGPAANNTLWAGFGGDCESSNDGDPIVLYDQISDRWMLSQFTAGGPTYYNCVAVSTTNDPTGSYYRYAFSTGSNFPDYPKYGFWWDALYISTREFAGASFAGVGAYAIHRAQLIAGNPTPQVISFLIPPGAAAYNVGDGLLPADVDGFTPPPGGSPEYFVGSMDDGGPYGAPQDALTLWKFTADFATPPNSSFVLANTIPIAAIDTIPAFCSGRSCVPQPGTANKVDHLGYRQRPLNRLAYRNFGTHESLVTNQSVEASPTMSGIRWWEIRSPNNSPVIYQEGTYAPGTVDGIHRWMGSAAMDSAGNIALGYSASNGTSTFPSVWYTGRRVGDPAGQMPQGEASIVNGTGSQTGSQRWGDYTSLNVDPIDDCTFWFVNQWVPTSGSIGWQLRVGSFRFNECGTPDFYLGATPASQAVCAPSAANFTVNVGQIAGFTDAVSLGVSGQPTGSAAGFSINPVSPPGSSTLTINPVLGHPGSYSLDVSGASTTGTKHVNVDLAVFDVAPGATTLVAPADGAVNVSRTPTFSWNAAAGAAGYSIEVATDAGFANVVASASGLGAPSWPSNVTLASNTQHYWRVRASNPCGDSALSNVFDFITVAAPGDCGTGTRRRVLYQYGFEAGASGWSSTGTGDTWAVSTANPHAGTQHYHANDPATVSDQRLASPTPGVLLPTGEDPVVVRFWHLPNLEPSGTTACYDGGILEVSTNDGASWTQVPDANLLVGSYRGTVSSSFSNPLAGLEAWCGETSYLETIADVSGYAGQTARFRFRLGSDTSVSRPGWDLDDVTVQSCQPAIFWDDFESADSCEWEPPSPACPAP